MEKDYEKYGKLYNMFFGTGLATQVICCLGVVYMAYFRH